jgi:hypothetical protein
MTRADSQPIKYTREGPDGRYVPELDERRAPRGRHWNLAKLSSRENPLVAFTLVSQAVIGAFTVLSAGRLLGLESLTALTATRTYPVFLFVLLGLLATVLFLSTQHLAACRTWVRFTRVRSILRTFSGKVFLKASR